MLIFWCTHFVPLLDELKCIVGAVPSPHQSHLMHTGWNGQSKYISGGSLEHLASCDLWIGTLREWGLYKNQENARAEKHAYWDLACTSTVSTAVFVCYSFSVEKKDLVQHLVPFQSDCRNRPTLSGIVNSEDQSFMFSLIKDERHQQFELNGARNLIWNIKHQN